MGRFDTPKDLFTARAQMRWGHNLLLFLVSLKSSPWQWHGFQQDDRHNDSIFENFLSPKWLCYRSSLTHLKCTKYHLQRSRFQKFSRRRNPRTHAFEGDALRRGREGERKGEGMRKGPESGLPRARTGSRRACLQLSTSSSSLSDRTRTEVPTWENPNVILWRHNDVILW